ncbi:MAG: hypothetical protein R3C56_17680 [Pirellulaceae bacterium]
MPVSPRRQKIEEMLQLEPLDIFLRYSLAMELSKEGQLPESLKLLQALCDAVPPYVPPFFARPSYWPTMTMLRGS